MKASELQTYATLSELARIGRKQLGLGNADKALATVNYMFELAPDDVLALDLAVDVYLAQKENHKALLASLQMALTSAGNYLVYLKLGQVLMRAGKYARAAAAIEIAYTLSPPPVRYPLFSDLFRELDKRQLEQIDQLAAGDDLFRIALGQDASEAVEAKGFVLSPAGLRKLRLQETGERVARFSLKPKLLN